MTQQEMDKQLQLSSLLIDVEASLRQLNQWQSHSPSADALASTEPFAIDSLTFPQWLQFIFLPRMYGMIERNDALPENCSMSLMAEEYFRGLGLDTASLLKSLLKVDELLS